jgi:hypothetical protein
VATAYVPGHFTLSSSIVLSPELRTLLLGDTIGRVDEQRYELVDIRP